MQNPIIALITDTHYAPLCYGGRDCPGSLARLQAALAASAHAGASAVVNLGDAIDTALTLEEEDALCRQVRAAFAAFPGPVYHALGNHDVAMYSKAEYLAAIGSPHPPYYNFDLGEIHGIILDGNCHEDGTDFDRGDFTWDNAWISTRQLDWLRDDLAANAGRPTLVFCHECLDDVQVDGQPDPHCVRNAADVRRLLRESGQVRGVIQGHYHHGRAGLLDGIPYLTLVATATGQGADDLAAALLTLTDNNLRLTGLGRQPSWPQ